MPTRHLYLPDKNLPLWHHFRPSAGFMPVREISHMLVKVILAALLLLVILGRCDLWGQENAGLPSVLHIEHSVTTSKAGFPQFLDMYRVLDGRNRRLRR
jgi:hypothetical protein